MWNANAQASYGTQGFTGAQVFTGAQGFHGAQGVSAYASTLRQRPQATNTPAVIHYGELVANGVEISRWTSLSIVQLLLLLYFFGFFIFFVLETQHVRFINLWIFMISFLGIGGILLLVQLIAYIFYRRASNLPTPSLSGTSTYVQAPSMSYMGKSHMREIIIAIIMTLFSYAIIGWLLVDFLFRFKNDDPGEGCCKASAANEPDINDPLEWRVFHGIFTLMSAIAFLTVITLVRTMFTHMVPLRSVSHIFTATDRKE